MALSGDERSGATGKSRTEGRKLSEERLMDTRQLGEAGLQGWRGRVAERVAPAVSRHSPFDDEQVSRAIGGLFLLLALMYLVKAGRQLARR